MNNIQEIKDKLKDSPELLQTLDSLINTPRQRDEIYMYCIKRETLDGKIHYIPVITALDGKKVIMACNNVMELQRDYKKEVIKYELLGLPLIILEVCFDTYVRLSIQIEKVLNGFSDKDFKATIKQLKAKMLLENTMIDPDVLATICYDIARAEGYCKCLDEKLNIVDCSNYKPIRSLLIRGVEL